MILESLALPQWALSSGSPLIDCFLLATLLTVGALLHNYLYTSSAGQHSKLDINRDNEIPAAPYWVPILAHGISFIIDPEKFLLNIR
jgi:hypothetical protein